MYCPACGTEVKDTDAFCASCGGSLSPPQTPAGMTSDAPTASTGVTDQPPASPTAAPAAQAPGAYIPPSPYAVPPPAPSAAQLRFANEPFEDLRKRGRLAASRAMFLAIVAPFVVVPIGRMTGSEQNIATALFLLLITLVVPLLASVIGWVHRALRNCYRLGADVPGDPTILTVVCFIPILNLVTLPVILAILLKASANPRGWRAAPLPDPFWRYVVAHVLGQIIPLVIYWDIWLFGQVVRQVSDAQFATATAMGLAPADAHRR